MQIPLIPVRREGWGGSIALIALIHASSFNASSGTIQCSFSSHHTLSSHLTPHTNSTSMAIIQPHRNDYTKTIQSHISSSVYCLHIIASESLIQLSELGHRTESPKIILKASKWQQKSFKPGLPQMRDWCSTTELLHSAVTCEMHVILILSPWLQFKWLYDFVFSAKIVVHLAPSGTDKVAGPVKSSKYAYIRLSFKEGGEHDVSYTEGFY